MYVIVSFLPGFGTEVLNASGSSVTTRLLNFTHSTLQKQVGQWKHRLCRICFENKLSAKITKSSAAVKKDFKTSHSTFVDFYLVLFVIRDIKDGS